MTGRFEKNDRIIAANIQRIRKQKKITDADIQEALGIHKGYLSKYENGTLNLSGGAVYAFARLLKVNVKKFFEGCE